MKTKAFFSQVDHDAMVAAIAAAEKHTTGEIRVYVSHGRVRDAQKTAMRHFRKLGMCKTKHRNAVLIFVAPESQNFAIIGDEAVHVRCGQPFWDQTAEEMRTFFQKQKYTEAIAHGIQNAGKILAQHFPHSRGDANELPDTILD
jgi:uncharacterized membrane protein